MRWMQRARLWPGFEVGPSKVPSLSLVLGLVLSLVMSLVKLAQKAYEIR